MRIALIVAPAWSTLTAPLGVASMAGAYKAAGHEVKVFDFNIRLWNMFRHLPDDMWSYSNFRAWANEEEFERVTLPHLAPKIPSLVQEVLAWGPELVGFSLYDTSIHCGRVMALQLKAQRPELPVIYGGPGASPWNVRRGRDFERGAVDAVVVGEGELSGLEAVERLSRQSDLDGCLGTLHRGTDGQVKQERARDNIHLNELPLPYFNDFDFAQYREQSLPIMMSRGCVAKCTFCSETRYWNKFRFREADHIVREMAQNMAQGRPSHYLVADSLVNGNFRVLGELAKKIVDEGLRLTWGGYARIDRRMTPELLKSMRQSGCSYLSFGLETGSQAVMDLMEKHTRVDVAKQVIRDTYFAGIEVHLNIVVGFPNEGEKEFQETLDFLTECRAFISIINTGETCAIPENTPMWSDPARFGITINERGEIVYGVNGEWESMGGANNALVRRDRLLRLRALLDSWDDVIWYPRGPRPQQRIRRFLPEFHP